MFLVSFRTFVKTTNYGVYERPLNDESELDRSSSIETDVQGLTLCSEQVHCIAVLLTNYHVLAKTSNFSHLKNKPALALSPTRELA